LCGLKIKFQKRKVFYYGEANDFEDQYIELIRCDTHYQKLEISWEWKTHSLENNRFHEGDVNHVTKNYFHESTPHTAMKSDIFVRVFNSPSWKWLPRHEIIYFHESDVFSWGSTWTVTKYGLLIIVNWSWKSRTTTKVFHLLICNEIL
jgi:hypothetical protein